MYREILRSNFIAPWKWQHVDSGKEGVWYACLHLLRHWIYESGSHSVFHQVDNAEYILRGLQQCTLSRRITLSFSQPEVFPTHFSESSLLDTVYHCYNIRITAVNLCITSSCKQYCDNKEFIFHNTNRIHFEQEIKNKFAEELRKIM